ncbi:glycoside hydrolase family 13 protein [Romboutsia weinsteinii]|uniref:Glycoside hydrolase family 13 protein n=1 Tax=Romboutsia weinsteinii TaxID=2020949 RepID=A0A371J3D7_9FIRM|nr:glycoside hydrolase family 13 protein [Romboutsia weinsteinii]RDY27178.1 glycoside hydrolase family 13 protein [Romboutsia weinsteinii]
MRNILSYNSWDESFKAPFGALKTNESARIKVKVDRGYDIDKISLIIFKEEEFIDKVELYNVSSISDEDNNTEYEGNISGFKEAGLYNYYFEVATIIDGNYVNIPYGKSIKNGETCEYNYENLNKYQITVYEDFKVPEWYKEGILYHVFVDRFSNGNRNEKPSNPKENSFIYGNWTDTPMYIKDSNGDIIRWDFHGGNLKGVINKLGYLKKLGVSIIYLSPIFEASSNHKYDTGDYKKIDPMFGDEEIFKELIDKASKRGISIILDGVFSHTGADSKYFNKFGRYDTVGAYQSSESPYSSWYSFAEFPQKYKCWWDIDALPNTNELAPTFKDYIIHDEDSVLKKWTSLGVKGWRLDVADELPTQFIREFKEELRNVDKDTILVGEVWEDASNKVSYGERRSYLLGQELDSVMGYPFRKNIVSFLTGEVSSEELNNSYMQTKENYPQESFKSNLNLLGTHDVNRIKTELGEDRDLMKLAVTTQMMFEGVPYIYYGDEAGLSGKTDPDNRRTYPWKNEDEDMIDFYRHLIGARNRNQAIVSGNTKFVYTNNSEVFGFVRYNDNKDDDNVLVLLNRSNKNQNIKIHLDANMLDELDIVYSPRKYGLSIEKEDNIFDINVEAKSFRLFSVKVKEENIAEEVNA